MLAAAFRMRRDRGSSTIEAIGVLAVTAVLVGLLVVASSPAALTAQRAREVVCVILDGSCAGPGGSGGPSGSYDGRGHDRGGDDGDDGSPLVVPVSAGGGPEQSCWPNPLRCAGSLLRNFGQAVVDEATGIWELLKDPSKLGDALEQLLRDPLGSLSQMVWDEESRRLWDAGDEAGAIGRLLWNGGSMVIPAGQLAKLGDAARLARLGRLTGAVEEVGSLARAAERAAAAGNVDEAARLAAEARSRSDALTADATRRGCLTVGHGDAPEPAGRVFALGGPGTRSVSLVVVPLEAVPARLLPQGPSQVRQAGPAVLAAGCGPSADAARSAQQQAAEAEAAVTRVPGNVDSVIAETQNGRGNITSAYRLSADEALEAGQRWVGPGYREIGGPGSGVFRSADGLRQFRIDRNSIEGRHAPNVPHVHLEQYGPGNRLLSNNHIPFHD